MSRNKLFKIESGLLAAGLGMLAVLSGCAGPSSEEGGRVVVEQEAPAVEYRLATVSRGDVVSFKGVRSTYTQQDSQKVSFEVSGRLVSKVYVKKGDKVQKGDLLAELSGGSREAEIEQLEYQIARNKMLLEQLDLTENYEISRRWLEAIYNGKQYEVDGIPGMQKNNEFSRQDYEDSIAIDEQKLAQIRNEVRQSKIYAEMDGAVSSIKSDLEGSTSVMDEVVMEIMDSSLCKFESKDMSLAEFVKEGQALELLVSAGNGAGSYVVEPYNRAEWTDYMFFTIVDGENSYALEAGATGTVNIVLDSRENVLTLPTACVHQADDKWYVYIVGEGNVREVKWVEVGLQGKDVVEIVSGLAEGEKVVLK